MCITKEIECQALCCCYENSFTTRHDNWSCLNQARSIRPKFPTIPVQIEWNRKFPETVFWKFWSTAPSCSFFQKWKCPVPFGICTRYESAPVRLVMTESYKMSGSRHYLYDVSTSESFIACLSFTKKLGMLFWKLWTIGCSEAPLGICLTVCLIYREKSPQVFLSRENYSRVF